jgi:O-antigen ligase
VAGAAGDGLMPILVPLALWCLSLAWITRVTVFIRQRGDFATVDAYAGVQIAIVLLAGLTVLASGRLFALLPRLVATSILALVAYYAVCAVSAIWSPLPPFSLYRAVEVIILLLSTFVALGYAKDFRRAETVVLTLSLIVMVLTVFARMKTRSFSLSMEDLHTNSYTAIGGMVFLYCLGEILNADGRRRFVLGGFGLIGFSGLAIGTSSGSNVATVVGLAAILVLARNAKLFVIMGVGGIVLAPLLAMVALEKDLVYQILFPGKSQENIETMTGRTTMWQGFLDEIYTHPMIGQGFAVLSSGRGQVLLSQPHNSFFSVMLGTGLLGMSFVLWFLGKLFFECWRTAMQKRPGAIGCASAMAMGIVNSLTNPFIFDKWEEATLIIVCFLALFTHFVYLPLKDDLRDSTGRVAAAFYLKPRAHT